MIPGTDPREALIQTKGKDLNQGVMPIVGRPRSGLSAMGIGFLIATAALGLFLTLNARRNALSAPTASRPQSDYFTEETTPSLVVPSDGPPGYANEAFAPIFPQEAVVPPPQVTRTPIKREPPRRFDQQAPPVQLQAAAPQPIMPQTALRTAGGPAIVFEAPRVTSSSAEAEGASKFAGRRGVLGSPDARARAGYFANKSTAIPQGTLIAAVLETGFDSTGPGFARALVQHDVRGFDGTRVLIPRGSRIIGEYLADVSPGQRRALITWTRLFRPDGATIQLDSPAADPVGRGGIRAHVNTHFFERFSGALLRSVLSIGSAIASRSRNNSVVVALPGSIQGATGALSSDDQIRPTLSIARGTSVSVLVARDLDFTEVERSSDAGR